MQLLQEVSQWLQPDLCQRQDQKVQNQIFFSLEMRENYYSNIWNRGNNCKIRGSSVSQGYLKPSSHNHIRNCNRSNLLLKGLWFTLSFSFFLTLFCFVTHGICFKRLNLWQSITCIGNKRVNSALSALVFFNTIKICF